MSKTLRALVVGLVVGLFVAFAPSCSGPAQTVCDATSCANGCCDSSGTCVNNPSTMQCGNGGATCRVCSAGQSCTNGTCVGGGTGGGSGGGSATGGGTAGGGTGTAGGGTGTAGGGTGTAGGGTGTAGGSGGGTGGAGGGSFPLDGGLPLTFMTTCPAFTACGGNLAPTSPTVWDITQGCVDDTAFDLVVNGMNLICGSMGTTVSAKQGRIQGGASFSTSTVTRNAAGYVRFNASHPTCPGCASIQPVLGGYGLTGSCAMNGTACDCTDLTFQIGSNSTDPYTVSGNTLTITTAARMRTFDYCVSTGGTPTLTYRETTAPAAGFFPDPGIITLTR